MVHGMTSNTFSNQASEVSPPLPVSIRIVPLPDPAGEELPGETLWAVPVTSSIHRLQNNAFFASLRLGDEVRTRADGLGVPQVVGIHRLHPGPVSVVRMPHWLPPETVTAVADSWRNLGAEYSESDGTHLVTAWAATSTARSVREVLQATAQGWTIVDLATRITRERRLPLELDYRLDTRTLADLEDEHPAWCQCRQGQPGGI